MFEAVIKLRNFERIRCYNFVKTTVKTEMLFRK